jgi:hypothetical protein
MRCCNYQTQCMCACAVCGGEEEVETQIRKPAGEGGSSNTHKRAPKLQGGWCKPNHQPKGDLEPRAGHAFVFVYITAVPILKLFAWGRGIV